jgi:hypothetical protein
MSDSRMQQLAALFEAFSDRGKVEKMIAFCREHAGPGFDEERARAAIGKVSEFLITGILPEEWR